MGNEITAAAAKLEAKKKAATTKKSHKKQKWHFEEIHSEAEEANSVANVTFAGRTRSSRKVDSCSSVKTAGKKRSRRSGSSGKLSADEESSSSANEDSKIHRDVSSDED